MGNYDLYGNHYKTAQEALNAEMAQCAEIDNRLLREEMKRLQNRINAIEENKYYNNHTDNPKNQAQQKEV